jgi:hypothetical protein
MNRPSFGEILAWRRNEKEFPYASVDVLYHRIVQCLRTALTFGALISAIGQVRAQSNKPMNIHNQMMEATCKITGDGSIGSGFIIGKPDPKQENHFFYTLITADHVLSSAKGENVVITIRREKSTDDWERLDLPVGIRSGGKQLWRKHPDVDLAGMLVSLPEGVMKNGVMPPTLLLSDEKIREFEITAGTELLCLGYPLGAEGNQEGFPILRSGKIASYPLLPTKKVKTFLFDFRVFQGNSGGPVYLYRENPVYGGGTHIGSVFGIIGVVTNEHSVIQTIEQLYEKREVKTPLSLAGVIPASFVAELIQSIPLPPAKN